VRAAANLAVGDRFDVFMADDGTIVMRPIRRDVRALGTILGPPPRALPPRADLDDEVAEAVAEEYEVSLKADR
jgi:bifunctional DNA-binding transcriptional regulator/antitoxin component of YhaV-PrlF toxin-antitoxin module